MYVRKNVGTYFMYVRNNVGTYFMYVRNKKNRSKQTEWQKGN